MHYSNPFGNCPPQQTVDMLLGKSYHVVKTVYLHLKSITVISEYIEELIKVAEVADTIIILKELADKLEPILNISNEIINISNNIEAINTVAELLESIPNIPETVEKILETGEYVKDFAEGTPRIVKSIRDVYNSKTDGYFWVENFNDPKHPEYGNLTIPLWNRSVKATSSSKYRVLEDRFADVINVRDYGAKGDGISDDTESIKAAIAASQLFGGKIVVFPFGHYKISSRITIPSGCIIDGMGSYIETTSNQQIFYIKGSGLSTEIPLASDVSTGYTSISTSVNHGFNSGDIALLWSQRNALSESAGDFRLGYHQGNKCYFAEPVIIKATPSSTTLTLASGIIFPDYKTNNTQDTDTNRTQSTISKINFIKNIQIKNFIIHHKGEGAVIQASFVNNLLIDNVIINTGVKSVYGVSLFGCYNVKINKMYMSVDPTADYSFDDDGFWKWTGIGCSSSWYITVNNCHFDSVPNGIDFTFYGDYWCSMFCTVENCFVTGSTANGITSHPGVYSNSFINNTLVDCEVPFTIRARKNRIIGNECLRTKPATESDDRAIILFAGSIDSIISNNTIEGFRVGIEDHAYSSGVFMHGKHSNIYSLNRIKNCARGITFSGGPENNTELVSCLVQGNSIEFEGYGIECQSWRHGIFAQGNYLKGTQSDAQSVAIRVEDDSTNHKFLDNIVENAKLYSIHLERTEDAYQDTIDSNNNIIYGYDILIGKGAYLNNGTYPKVSRRYEKLLLSRVNTNVQNNYGAGTLLVLENNNGCTSSMVSADGKGYSTLEFLDNILNKKASISYGYVANRLNIGVEDSMWRFSASTLSPNTDNVFSVGSSTERVSEIFAGSGSINTSDIRFKQNLAEPEEKLLKAWGNVKYKLFQFKDAVEKKGTNARLHTGVIAQEVKKAFEDQGLDASKYGLFCYDEWQDEYEPIEVIDQEEVLDKEGNVISPVITHTEQKKVLSAGNRYGIRYEEALALECAYLRNELSKIKTALANKGISLEN